MKEIIERLMILSNAFDLSHRDENAKNIWWYHVPSGKMLAYGPDVVSGHLDQKFGKEPVVGEGRGWIKGRVFSYGMYTYLMIYAARAGGISQDLAGKLALLFRNKYDIDFVIDDNGYSLLESKK